MKITVQLDPENLALIRGNAKSQKLAKNFLKALSVPENLINNWEGTHEVEIDNQAGLQFSEMSCHIPDGLNKAPQWIYSFKVFDGGCLLRINNQPFWAQVDTDGGIELLPDELINLYCAGWSSGEISSSLKKFTQLSSLGITKFPMLTKLYDFSNLTNLNFLGISLCRSIVDISSLAKLKQIKYVDISGSYKLVDISPLKNLNKITSLKLSGCECLNDISPLGNLKQLKFLNLWNCHRLTDIRPLANLNQLKSLNLSWVTMTEISTLNSLKQLNRLNISGCNSISDIQALENLDKLEFLTYNCQRYLTDIGYLFNLNRLVSLDISNCYNLSDITPLSNLNHLTSLDLSKCNTLTDIRPLSNLNQLTSLNLSNCDSLNDIRPLSNLNHLTSLDLSMCEALTDIRPLSNLNQLASLDLSKCKTLTDIRPLSNLNHLTSLDLTECDLLDDISPLSDLNQITSIGLSKCSSLTDLRPLADIKQLMELNISQSECSDIRPLSSIERIASLDLSFCYSLIDVSPLANLNHLASLNLLGCEFLTDITVLSKLKQLETINLKECRRITKYADFKSLDRLRELEIDIHPAIIADILAHCAVARQDWAFVDEKSSDWLTELASALKDSHPAAVDLATSLGTAFPYIPDADLTQQLINVLQTDSFLGYLPWKCLLAGTLEVSGLDALQTQTSNLPEEWPSGAIGGLCAITGPLLRQSGGREWLEKLVLNFSGLHDSNPSFLKPVAAPWCLALQLLGKQELLDQWIVRFTDPDDCSALDSVYRGFARRAVSQGLDVQARAWCGWIKNPLVRDEGLMEVADLLLQGPLPEAAAEYLFLLSEPNARTRLAGKLADVPGYLTDRGNVHRLLAACGRDAEAVGALLARAGLAEEFHSVDSAALRALAAREGARVAGGIAGLTEHETVGLRRLLETQLDGTRKPE